VAGEDILELDDGRMKMAGTTEPREQSSRRGEGESRAGIEQVQALYGKGDRYF